MPGYKRSHTSEPYSKRPRTSYSSGRDSEYAGKWSKYHQMEPIKIPKKSDPNNILRVVVWNPHYQVTTETLHYLFTQYGYVRRIILFTKNGLPNGMVEFDSIEGASRARDYLNGFDMYWGGGNKLQIEFAWTAELFVVTNDIHKSWDYTKTRGTYYQPTLDQELNTFYDSSYQYTQAQPVYENFGAGDYYNVTNSNLTMTQYQPQAQQQGQKTQQPMILFASAPLFQPSVMYVSGLNFDSSSTDKLFNLLSLYGNVAKIQFLLNRQGTAIVQMFDSQSVDYCIQYLNNAPIGSHGKLLVYWANPNYLPNNENPFTLSDGSSNYKDYTLSKNQRFLVPRPSFWIQPPSKIVRYYNTPSSLSEENIVDIFSYKNVKPMEVRSLRMPADEESHMTRGLLEFSSVAQAVLAIMKCNNKEIRSKTQTIHYMKLCFSSSQTLQLKN